MTVAPLISLYFQQRLEQCAEGFVNIPVVTHVINFQKGLLLVHPIDDALAPGLVGPISCKLSA